MPDPKTTPAATDAQTSTVTQSAADASDLKSARMDGIINDLLKLALNAPADSHIRKMAVRAVDTALPATLRDEGRIEDVAAAHAVLNDIYGLLRDHPEHAGVRRAATWVERAVFS